MNLTHSVGNTWVCTVVQQSASIPNGSPGGVLHFGLLVYTLLGIPDLWFINYSVREKTESCGTTVMGMLFDDYEIVIAHQ